MSTFLTAVSRVLRLGAYQQKVTSKNVIFITGCDSGLGFSLALYCHSLNMTVISACHNNNSDGAKLLKQLSNPERMIVIEVDLLKQQTIVDAGKRLTDLIKLNNYEFTALVNNAGQMIFGEFEWQTMEQIEMQLNVNLLGTMRLTKELLPLIRQQHGRIINITSHCGLQALPSLTAYAASKAALCSWNNALRIEMQQYDVNVINFIPGSFVMSSNISARQPNHAINMFNKFTIEQHQFYDNYFKGFNSYLNIISGFKPPNSLKDIKLLAKFHDALTNKQPKELYKHEPWRYKFYFLLFRWCPTAIVDWLTVKFCAMPTYNQFKVQNSEHNANEME